MTKFFAIVLYGSSSFFIGGPAYNTLEECTRALPGIAKSFINRELKGIGCLTEELMARMGIQKS